MSDYTAVERVAEIFHHAISRKASDQLSQVLFPFWRCKRIDKNCGIQIETCADMALRQRVDQSTVAVIPQLSSIQLCFGDFAIVRTDAWSERATSFHLLFKERDIWRIAGTVSVDAAAGRHDSAYAARDEEAAVLKVLGEYYRAVTTGEGQPIKRIFAPVWEMKNHHNGFVVVEDKQSFATRIEARPVPGYDQDRQIADVQIIAERLAYVRIDKPSVPVTTVFFLVKWAANWLIVDKAWSAGDKA